MEENNANGIPKEEPTGNLIIRLKDFDSFEGNQSLNRVEAVVDDAFKSFLTISIEAQERKYYKENRQALLDEIYELLKIRREAKQQQFVESNLLPGEKIIATAEFHPLRNIIIPIVFLLFVLILSMYKPFMKSHLFCTGYNLEAAFWEGQPIIIYSGYLPYTDSIAIVKQSGARVTSDRDRFWKALDYCDYNAFKYWKDEPYKRILYYLFNIVLFWGLFFLIKWINRKSEFVITNKRVVAKVGLIRRIAFELQTEQVESIGIYQGILGRLFNYGTLMPCGVGASKVHIRFVKNPFEFRQHFYDLKKDQNN